MTKEKFFTNFFPAIFNIFLAAALYVFLVLRGGHGWDWIESVAYCGAVSVVVLPIISFFVFKKWSMALKTLAISIITVYIVFCCVVWLNWRFL